MLKPDPQTLQTVIIFPKGSLASKKKQENYLILKHNFSKFSNWEQLGIKLSQKGTLYCIPIIEVFLPLNLLMYNCYSLLLHHSTLFHRCSNDKSCLRWRNARTRALDKLLFQKSMTCTVLIKKEHCTVCPSLRFSFPLTYRCTIATHCYYIILPFSIDVAMTRAA